MAMDFESSRSTTNYRFGQLSKNMFFTRHVAQPRYLRFLTGAIGQRVCHVREQPIPLPIMKTGDLNRSLMNDPRFNIEFAPHSYNDTLLQSYADKIQPKKRRERLLPPMPGWNPSGVVVPDTDNWRRELARIAEMIGFVTSDELLDIESRKETPPELPHISPATASKRPKSSGQYSRQSGRWNETPKSATRSRSASRRRPPLKPNLPNHLFCVDEQEREIWMLQVLCQILKTDNMHEVQSWLVSSGPTEKEAVRQLITTAIKGLQESGRIKTNENEKGIQVNMDSFGSLLANKFSHVSSATPVTPSNETPTRPLSRPRTAPVSQTRVHSRTELHCKSVGAFHTNLDLINENTESICLSTDVISVTPAEVADTKNDIQILKLDDTESQSQLINNEETEKVPF